jgi:hypothetical protein
MTSNDMDQAITLYFDSREHGGGGGGRPSLHEEQESKEKNKQISSYGSSSQQVRAPIPPKQDTLIEKGHHLPGIGRFA